MNGKEQIIPCDTILPVQLRQKHYAALMRAETVLADANDAVDVIRVLLMDCENNGLCTSGIFGVFGAAIGSALEEVEGVTRSMQLQMRGEAAQ